MVKRCNKQTLTWSCRTIYNFLNDFVRIHTRSSNCYISRLQTRHNFLVNVEVLLFHYVLERKVAVVVEDIMVVTEPAEPTHIISKYIQCTFCSNVIGSN
jgi:hypothetical protein